MFEVGMKGTDKPDLLLAVENWFGFSQKQASKVVVASPQKLVASCTSGLKTSRCRTLKPLLIHKLIINDLLGTDGAHRLGLNLRRKQIHPEATVMRVQSYMVERAPLVLARKRSAYGVILIILVKDVVV